MGIATDIAFYAGTACYIAAAVITLSYLKGTDRRVLSVAAGLMTAGAACFVATFAMRWATWRLVPLTTMADSLNLFALLTTIIILVVVRRERVLALLCFYVPPLGIACLINGIAGRGDLHVAPRALSSAPLVGHVSLAFAAYAMFFLASMTSAAYLFQANRLKLHQTTGLFQRLPSLEQLDRTLYLLISHGYPFFVITLVWGVAWAWLDSDVLSPRWWLAPKVVLSFVMAAFYAFTFHSRRAGRLRGPKLAYFVFVGFSVLLAAYLVMSVMHLRSYNFWSTQL